MIADQPHPEQVQSFAARMTEILNSGGLALMISIGHRTGLLDVMARLSPSTSQQIADAAGLNERYVREWLGAMASGRIVEYDPQARTYLLPAGHAAWLTRAVGGDNLAMLAQYIPLLGAVEDGVVHAFRHGGGVPYAQFARFHQLMAEDSAVNVVARLVEVTLPRVAGLVDRLHSGIDVLDVGCGSGRAINRMAQAFPHSRFTGYDFSEEAINAARAEAAAFGLRNACFSVKDAAEMSDEATCDLITSFDAIHDQAKPALVLRNIARALRPDGIYLMQDIRASSQLENNLDNPSAPFMYTISTMHCMTVSLALGGDGLGAMWGEEIAQELLSQAGFAHVEMFYVDHDANNTYYVARKGT